MDAPAENFLRELVPSKHINLFSLDKNIAHLISGYLTDKEVANLCMASKEFHSLFRSSLERHLISYFLKYVIEGRLDKVEEILNRNQKLVFLQGNITDLSGRVFTRITAFQYAVWALDKEMWELILRYLPEVDAYNQLIELEQKRPDITEIYGKRFNFQSLLNAYQKYIDNFDVWSKAKRWKQLEACWREEVGRAQRQMPAWFVYVFCEEGEDIVWLTENFKKNFTRDPKHLYWWFNQEYSNGTLGFRGGCIRGRVGRAAAFDRQHLSSWKAERMNCRDSLSDYLRYAVETKSSPVPLNNSRK